MIRAAVPADAAAVAALVNAINSLDHRPPEIPMTEAVVLRDLIGAQAKAILRVAEHEGQIAGFATAGLIYDGSRSGWALMLLDLYVAPDARRRGLARGLMASLAAEALRQDAGCLWWGVDEGDDEATLFYRSIGAVSEGWFSGEVLLKGAMESLAREHRG